MKKYLVITLIALLTTLTTGCGGRTDAPKNKATDEKSNKIKKQYTCTMDPDVLKDKPGICPKCGMQLVEKEKDN